MEIDQRHTTVLSPVERKLYHESLSHIDHSQLINMQLIEDLN